MKIALVFPPYFISYQPYSSLPALAGYLRAYGHRVSLFDENIEFIDHYMNPDFFRQIFHDTRRVIFDLRSKNARSGTEQILLRFADHCFRKFYFDTVIRSIEASVHILRDRDLIANELKANQARDVLIKGQNLLNQYFRFNQMRRSQKETANFDLRWEDIERELEADTEYKAYFQANVIPKIRTVKPDILGISIIFEEQIIPAFILAKTLRKTADLQDMHITLGGPVITIIRDVIERHPAVFSIINSCIVYEGEEALLKLAEDLEANRGLAAVPNLVYKKGDRIVGNPVRMIEDMDSLPTPDFDGMPLEKYYSADLVPVLKPTRGCYWNRCAFCNNRFLNNYTLYRARSPERIFEDFVRLHGKYHVEVFTLWEEAAVPKTLKKLANLVERSDYDFKWFAEARLDSVYTRHLFDSLYRGGCRGMVFGLESGNKRVQALMNKGYDLEVSRRIIRDCHKAGIRVYITLMVGFPGETFQEALDTIRFISDNTRYIFHAGVSHFGLRKYTDTYERPHAYGIEVTVDKDSFSSIGDLNYGTRNIGMRQNESMASYNMMTRKLSELGLTRNEPECHFLIRINRRAETSAMTG